MCHQPSGEDIFDSGMVDAGGEDDGEDDEESGDLTFVELVVDGVLSCHRPDLPGLKPLLSMRFNGTVEAVPLQREIPFQNSSPSETGRVVTWASPAW